MGILVTERVVVCIFVKRVFVCDGRLREAKREVGVENVTFYGGIMKLAPTPYILLFMRRWGARCQGPHSEYKILHFSLMISGILRNFQIFWFSPDIIPWLFAAGDFFHNCSWLCLIVSPKWAPCNRKKSHQLCIHVYLICPGRRQSSLWHSTGRTDVTDPCRSVAQQGWQPSVGACHRYLGQATGRPGAECYLSSSVATLCQDSRKYINKYIDRGTWKENVQRLNCSYVTEAVMPEVRLKRGALWNMVVQVQVHVYC